MADEFAPVCEADDRAAICSWYCLPRLDPVWLICRDARKIFRQKCDRHRRRIGAAAIGIAVDVADENSVAAAAAMTADRLGGIDILVTSAAIAGPNATLANTPARSGAG
jgi:NAD(P)-dependent dehydrogenase (short-subunit alcohol dehydrogenase family)